MFNNNTANIKATIKLFDSPIINKFILWVLYVNLLAKKSINDIFAIFLTNIDDYYIYIILFMIDNCKKCKI